MKLAIMQPYFMPYLGYWQAIAAVDKYILYDNLTFIKDGWMNRNRLLLTNGNITTITVPLIGKSSNTLISEIQIDNSKKWECKLLNTIKLNYGKSAFFKEVFPLFETLFSVRYDKLCVLNGETIKAIAKFLDIDTLIETDNTSYIKMEEQLCDIDKGDYSAFSYLTKTNPVKKVARVIVMCKNEDCTYFVNAIGGQSLYSKEEFKQYGIDLHFISTNSDIQYNQRQVSFEPNLSIIDVLMHNGKERTKALLNRYTLI